MYIAQATEEQELKYLDEHYSHLSEAYLKLKEKFLKAEKELNSEQIRIRQLMEVSHS
jgi:hypothetical protein